MSELSEILDCVWPQTDPALLVPETDPEAIAEAQRSEVAKAVDKFGSDVEAISAVVCLPQCSVRRILRGLGIRVAKAKTPDRKPTRGEYVKVFAARLRAWLKEHGPATTLEAAHGLGATPYQVNRAVRLLGGFRDAGSKVEVDSRGRDHPKRLLTVAKRDAVGV